MAKLLPSPTAAAALSTQIRSLLSPVSLLAAARLAVSAAPSSLPDPQTLALLTRHLAAVRSPSSVRSFLSLLSARSRSGPLPALPYVAFVESVCARGNPRDAAKLISFLADATGEPAHAYIYNTIMKAHCAAGDPAGVMAVYNRMKEDSVEPDIVTYSTVVFGLSKAGMVVQARRFLTVMSDAGHSPDVVTYTALMSGMLRTGDISGALALVEEMEGRGCAPNERTFNALLMGLCKGNALDKAMEVYLKMVGEAMPLESPSYATLVRALCKNRRAAEAYEVFDYAVGRNYVPGPTAYLALESSLRWLRKMKP